MKALLLMLALAGAAGAAPIDEAYAERVCAAIHAAEGGKKAKTPYGVLSVRTRSEAHAKALCLNSVRNAWGRWEADGRPGDFIEHLGQRYCPTKGAITANERKLNSNWVRNVRFFLRRSDKDLRDLPDSAGRN